MIVTNEIARIAQALLKDSSFTLTESNWQSLTPLNLTPGQMVQGEVMANLPNNRYLIRLANQLLNMELPVNLQPGQTVELTYVTEEPQLVFAFSQEANAEVPVRISDTGRWLNQLAAEDGLPPPTATPLPRPSLVSATPPGDTGALAAGLREVLGKSGLFYESHLAQWLRGERPLAELLGEPQGTLSRLAGFLAGADEPPGATPPAAGQAAPATDTAPPSRTIGGQGAIPTEQPPEPTGGNPPNGPVAKGEEALPGSRPESTPPSGSTLPEGGVAHGEPPARGGAGWPPPPDSDQPASIGTRNDPPAAGNRSQPATASPPSGSAEPPAATVASPGHPSSPTASGSGVAPPLTPAPEGGSRETAQSGAGFRPPPASVATAPERAADRQSSLATETRSGHSTPPHAGPLQLPLTRLQPPLPGTAELPLLPARSGEPPPPDKSALFRAAVPESLQGGIDPQTLPLIKEQLTVLTTGQFTWYGQVWPEQFMEWKVDEREGGRHQQGERAWETEVRLVLPRLGAIKAAIRLSGGEVAVNVAATEERTGSSLSAGKGNLEERLEAAGLRLSGLVVRHAEG